MNEESLQSSTHGVPKYKMPLAVIIGMPAAGKTRVGKELAHILNVPFIDTDDLIERLASILRILVKSLLEILKLKLLKMLFLQILSNPPQ